MYIYTIQSMSYTAPPPIRLPGAGSPHNSATNSMNGKIGLQSGLMKAATGGKTRRKIGGLVAHVIPTLYPDGGGTTSVSVNTARASSEAYTNAMTDKVGLVKGGMGRSRRTRYTKRSRKGRNGRKSRRSRRTRRM